MQRPTLTPRLLWSYRTAVPIQAGQVAFAPNSDFLLLASSEKAKAEHRATLDVFELPTGKVERHLTFSGNFLAAVWSPHNRYIGGVGTVEQEGEYRGVGCLWEMATGKFLRPFLIWGERAFHSAVFAPDGSTLYLGTHRDAGQGRIHVWDVGTGRVIRKVEPEPPVAIWSLALTTDGKTLAVSSGRRRQAGDGWKDWAVRLYDSATGRPGRILPRPNGQAPTVPVVSPDSRFVVMGDGPNGDVIACDLLSGKRVHTLKGHRGAVLTAAIAPNGRWFVTGGKDRTVRFWNGEVGSQTECLTRHGGEIQAVAFSPDGNFLATGDDTGELLLWETRENGPLPP